MRLHVSFFVTVACSYMSVASCENRDIPRGKPVTNRERYEEQSKFFARTSELTKKQTMPDWRSGLANAGGSRAVDLHFYRGLYETPAEALCQLIERTLDDRAPAPVLSRCLEISAMILDRKPLDSNDDTLKFFVRPASKLTPEVRAAFRKQLQSKKSTIVGILVARVRAGKVDLDSAAKWAYAMDEDMPALWMLGLNRAHPLAIEYWKEKLEKESVEESLRFATDPEIKLDELRKFMAALQTNHLVSCDDLTSERNRSLQLLCDETRTNQQPTDSLMFALGLSGRHDQAGRDLASLYHSSSRARIEILLKEFEIR